MRSTPDGSGLKRRHRVIKAKNRTEENAAHTDQVENAVEHVGEHNREEQSARRARRSEHVLLLVLAHALGVVRVDFRVELLLVAPRELGAAHLLARREPPAGLRAQLGVPRLDHRRVLVGARAAAHALHLGAIVLERRVHRRQVVRLRCRQVHRLGLRQLVRRVDAHVTLQVVYTIDKRETLQLLVRLHTRNCRIGKFIRVRVDWKTIGQLETIILWNSLKRAARLMSY